MKIKLMHKNYEVLFLNSICLVHVTIVSGALTMCSNDCVILHVLHRSFLTYMLGNLLMFGCIYCKCMYFNRGPQGRLDLSN